jgi:NADH dehydrogenase [ubiquinone] 1 alpha subcomplex assembly factor 1
MNILRLSVLMMVLMPLRAFSVDITNLNWYVVNDGVMGGRSSGFVHIKNEALYFSGKISLENNGGFTSIRAPLAEFNQFSNNLNFTVLGDGHEYQLRFKVDSRFDGPAFVYKFKTVKGKLHTFNLAGDDFKLQFRGRVLNRDEKLDFNDIKSIGLLISDKNAKQFKLSLLELVFLQST